MRVRLRLIALCLLLLTPLIGEARIFNYKEGGLAPYLRGTGGLSSLAQEPFAHSSGAGVTVNDRTNFNFGGELGIVLGLTSNFHIRLGAEVLQEGIVNGDGVDSAGTAQFTLNSSVFVFNPNAVFEYVYRATGSTRFFVELGAGYSNVTVVNDYKMTPAGTTAFGVSDFKETMEANVMSGIFGLGIESLFTDNVTFMIDVGYRYLPVYNLKYKNDANTILVPTGVRKGDAVLNDDGSNRKFNLGGPFGAIAFRFYLNFL